MKKIRIFTLLIAALFALNIQISSARQKKQGKTKNLYVYFFDVGQGDGAFIRTPNGKNILIDGGQGANEYDSFDAGKSVIIPFLIRKKIKKIHYVVASHAHNDHIGGLNSIMKKYPIGTVYDSGFPYPSPIYTEFLKIIKKKKIKYKIVRQGDVLNWDPDLKVEVLAPKTVKLFNDPNNNSIVLKITYGEVSFLFTGDIEKSAGNEILYNCKESQVSSVILKVPHHGSKSSPTEDFLDTVNPEVAVISCGRYNRFRHPHSSTIRKYNDFGIEIRRTDKEGTIFMSTDGDTFTIKALGFKK